MSGTSVITPDWQKHWRRLLYYLMVPKTWLQLTLHNSWGILNVLDIIWLRPMPGGMIGERPSARAR